MPPVSLVRSVSAARLATFIEAGPLRDVIGEYFAARIRNAHTRRAYVVALRRFLAWCQAAGLALEELRPVHVAAYVEQLGRERARPTVKQHLAALRQLFDWLVVRQLLATNPAAPVRGPKHVARRGKTPVLAPDEVRRLLSSIDTGTLLGLRDRALLAVLAYSFARVGALIKLRVEDYYTEGRRGRLRLSEKGGQERDLPCHHVLEALLDEYLERSGLHATPRAPLFQSLRRDGWSGLPLAQSNIHAMIRKRCRQAGIETLVGCHSFRATGITTYLANGGRLEVAQHMAGHASPRTTSLYDRRADVVEIDEVERVWY